MSSSYTINFSIETTSDKLQKICDDLLSDLQSKAQAKQSIHHVGGEKQDIITTLVTPMPIQLNHYLIDEDGQNISVEVEILNLNQEILDYLIKRIKTGEFDPNFQEYKVYDSKFNTNEQTGLFTYLFDKMKDEFHLVPTNE